MHTHLGHALSNVQTYMGAAHMVASLKVIFDDTGPSPEVKPLVGDLIVAPEPFQALQSAS